MSSVKLERSVPDMQNAEHIWAGWREKIRLSALARHLGVSRQGVADWPQVPEDRHTAVAAWLGIEPRDLRPDLYPERKDQ